MMCASGSFEDCNAVSSPARRNDHVPRTRRLREPGLFRPPADTRDAFPASSSSITCPAGTNGPPTWCGNSPITAMPRWRPNLFTRFGPGDPDDVAARARPAGGAYDAEVMGDVAACMAHLRALPERQRQDRRDRLLLRRPSYLSRGLHPARYRRRRRLLGRSRHRRRSEGILAAARGRADRAHREARLPAARHFRQRRQKPDRRSGQPHRAGAQAPRQDLRIPPLRRRRSLVLRLRPPRLSAGAVRRRLAKGLRLLRQTSGRGGRPVGAAA